MSQQLSIKYLCMAVLGFINLIFNKIRQYALTCAFLFLQNSAGLHLYHCLYLQSIFKYRNYTRNPIQLQNSDQISRHNLLTDVLK